LVLGFRSLSLCVCGFSSPIYHRGSANGVSFSHIVGEFLCKHVSLRVSKQNQLTWFGGSGEHSVFGNILSNPQRCCFTPKNRILNILTKVVDGFGVYSSLSHSPRLTATVRFSSKSDEGEAQTKPSPAVRKGGYQQRLHERIQKQKAECERKRAKRRST
jgi:hypothetical protein